MKPHEKIVALIKSTCSPIRAALLVDLVTAHAARFDIAPASSAQRFHQAYDGGLADHIVSVADYANKMAGALDLDLRNSITTVAVLHDLNKIGDASGNHHYVPNVSEKTGKRSEAVPYEKNKSAHKPVTGIAEVDAIIQYAELGCGEMSLAVLAALQPDLLSDLSESEINAIRFHDAGYGKAKYAAGYQGKEDQLVILIHAADMMSSRERNWQS